MLAETIAILAAVILIPLLPAFVLYKLLPSTATVKGPLQGLQLNLSGAFAGYFALVVFALVIVETARPESPATEPKYEEFLITGRVALENPPPGADARRARIGFHPKVTQVEGPFDEGVFFWSTTLLLERTSDDRLKVPFELIFAEYPGYISTSVEFRSGDIQGDTRTISFDDMRLTPEPEPDGEPEQEVELR